MEPDTPVKKKEREKNAFRKVNQSKSVFESWQRTLAGDGKKRLGRREGTERGKGSPKERKSRNKERRKRIIPVKSHLLFLNGRVT